MKQYIKKPIVISAVQFDNNLEELHTFVTSGKLVSSNINNLYIETLEGDMLVSPGDYVIKGIQGEFYPCKPDIFLASYNLIVEE